ncbi:MAG: D-aminoacyl-tRNA deacylase, partial [Vicinamibacterales bacterium]
MRAVVQRVTRASVTVADRVIGEIGAGLLAFVGVERGDDGADVEYVAGKIRDVRIFEDEGDEAGRTRMSRSVIDVG